jgi:hypothetical protein
MSKKGCPALFRTPSGRFCASLRLRPGQPPTPHYGTAQRHGRIQMEEMTGSYLHVTAFVRSTVHVSPSIAASTGSPFHVLKVVPATTLPASTGSRLHVVAFVRSIVHVPRSIAASTGSRLHALKVVPSTIVPASTGSYLHVRSIVHVNLLPIAASSESHLHVS